MRDDVEQASARAPGHLPRETTPPELRPSGFEQPNRSRDGLLLRLIERRPPVPEFVGILDFP